MDISQGKNNKRAEAPTSPVNTGPVERSQLDDLSFSTSAGKRSELQREHANQRKQSVTAAEFNSPEQHATSSDPRMLQIQEQRQELKEKLEVQQTLIRGTEFNINSAKQQVETGGMTGFFMWSSGAKDTIRKDISSMEELNKARIKQVTEMKVALEKQRAAAEQFNKLDQQGKELQAKGDIPNARKAFHAAHNVLATSINRTQPSVVVDTATYRDAQRQVSQGLSDSQRNLDKTEAVLRTTQKVAVIGGATVATGGAALAIGGATGATVGVIAGTAYGTATGGAAALTEASGHITVGNKTTQQALTDARDQTLESARDSVIASVGTVAGIGVGGKVAGGIAARIGTSTTAKIVTAAANGSAAGATSATISTTANTSIEYAAASREFSQRFDSTKLTPADREQAYATFMEERGLTAPGIARRYAHDVSIGALGGALGGATGAGKDLVGPSRRAALSIEGGQIVADIGIGLGDAAVQGQLNAEGITSSIAGAVIGNVSGRVSHRKFAGQPQSQLNPSSATQEIPVGGELLRHSAAPALENPILDKSVSKMLADTDHPMDLTRNLQHLRYGPSVKRNLQEISTIKGMSQEEFVRVVADSRDNVRALFPQDDTQFNFTPSGESRMRLLRDTMMRSEPVLHSIGDDHVLTPTQQERLKAHADKIKTQVLPNFQSALEDVAQVVSPDSYARVTSRAKSADGLHEKVTRMQGGNQGRGTRPEYRLADVPDAVGGRIVVEDIGDLAKVTSAIEERFQGNIYEKDNFYLNEKKSQRPYRVITYTVLQDSVPCEIQVMTLSSNVSSDIDHNTVYKQLIGLEAHERQQVTDWWRGVTAKELHDLQPK